MGSAQRESCVGLSFLSQDGSTGSGRKAGYFDHRQLLRGCEETQPDLPEAQPEKRTFCTSKIVILGDLK